jgi:hypothetical protein
MTAWQAESERLAAENAELRKELREYWEAYHDEHCHFAQWPHEGRCFYSPPEVLQGSQ